MKLTYTIDRNSFSLSLRPARVEGDKVIPLPELTVTGEQVFALLNGDAIVQAIAKWDHLNQLAGVEADLAAKREELKKLDLQIGSKKRKGRR